MGAVSRGEETKPPGHGWEKDLQPPPSPSLNVMLHHEYIIHVVQVDCLCFCTIKTCTIATSFISFIRVRLLRHYVRACAIIAVLLDEEFLSLEGVIIRLCHLVPGLNPALVRRCAADIDALRVALSSTQLLQ